MGDVNFIPAARLAAKKRKARIRAWGTICVVYALLLVTLTLLAYGLWGTTDTSIEQDRQSTEQAIQQHNLTVVQLRGKLARALAEQRLGRAILRQPDWSKLLGLLAEELGNDIVLSHFGLAALNTDGKDAAENLKEWFSASSAGPLLAEGRYRLRLTGFGHSQNSVSQFILRLEQTGVFESVKLMTSNRQTFLDDQAVAFSIECGI
jgi:Tfp pilus assembly protein PilN